MLFSVVNLFKYDKAIKLVENQLTLVLKLHYRKAFDEILDISKRRKHYQSKLKDLIIKYSKQKTLSQINDLLGSKNYQKEYKRKRVATEK